MKKSERMKTVQHIADRKEQAQAALLSQAQQNLELHQAKLREIEQYYREYAHAASIDANRHIDLSHLQENRLFLQKLSQAVASQKKNVADAERLVKKERRLWIEARSHCLSRNALADRYRAAEIQEAERTEQRIADDQNTQRFVWRQTQNYSSSEMA